MLEPKYCSAQVYVCVLKHADFLVGIGLFKHVNLSICIDWP